MRKKHTKIILFTALCVCVIAGLFMALNRDIENDVIENPYTPQNDYYTVTEYQGKIAVFKNNDKIPFDVYDTYVEYLPEHDRQLLIDGIRADTPDELQKIIEDYTSQIILISTLAVFSFPSRVISTMPLSRSEKSAFSPFTATV